MTTPSLIGDEARHIELEPVLNFQVLRVVPDVDHHLDVLVVDQHQLMAKLLCWQRGVKALHLERERFWHAEAHRRRVELPKLVSRRNSELQLLVATCGARALIDLALVTASGY